MDKTPSEGICVAIRMRPLNEREVTMGQAPVFRCLKQHNAVAQIRADGQPIEGQINHYDKVFDEKATTNDVYDYVGTKIVEGVVKGVNGTIFAYGQTSSGKTFTMLGANQASGVLELAAIDLFKYMGECNDRDFIVRVSFVEIYNEIIRDLLSESHDNTVAIREDPRKGVYCEATEHVIGDFDGIMKAVQKGCVRRSVESTAMNDTSSRSHTIFKLTVESISSERCGEERDTAVWVSALNLVDLAGSESVRHTGATGQRAKEGGKINQSLLSLSRVIHALSQPGSHVSFRDSKLTRLLQPSLSGNAKMSVVCCVTAAERYIEETRSTLQFASRAKLVKTNATVNEILDESAKIKRLTKELNQLKEKQAADGLTDGDRVRLEAEREELLKRLESLENEKDEQKANLERLKDMFFSSSECPSLSVNGSMLKKKRKTKRDTWCPGAGAVRGEFKPLLAPMAETAMDEPTLQEDDHSLVTEEPDRQQLQTALDCLEKENRSQKEHIEELLRSLNDKSISCPLPSKGETDSIVADQMAALQQTLMETNHKLKEMTYKRNDLDERLQVEIGASTETEREMESQIDKLNATIRELKSENIALNSQLEAAQQNRSLVDENLSMEEQQKYLNAQSEMASLDLTAQIAVNTEQLKALSDENTQVRSENAALSGELEVCKDELEAAQAFIAAIEVQLSFQMQKTGAWEAEVLRLNGFIASLQDNLDNTTSKQEQYVTNIQQLTDELDRLGSDMLSQREIYTEEVEALRSQLQVDSCIDEQRAKLHEVLSQKDAEITDLSSKHVELSTRFVQIELAMENNQREHGDQLSAKQDEIDSLSVAAEEIKERYQRALHESHEIEYKLRASAEALEELESKLSTSKQNEDSDWLNICFILGVTEKNDLVIRINQLQEAERELLLMTETQDTLQAQLDESVSRCQSLTECKDILQNTIEELRTQISEMAQEHGALSQNLSAVQEGKGETDDLIRALQSTIACTDESNKSLDEQVRELLSRVESAEKNLEVVSAERDELETVATAMKEGNMSELCEGNFSEARLIELENKYLTAEVKCQALGDEVSDLRARLKLTHAEADGFAEIASVSKKEGERDMEKMTAALGHKDFTISQLLQEAAALQERAATAEQTVKMLLEQDSSGSAESEVILKKCKQLHSQIDFLIGEKERLNILLTTAEKEKKELEYELEKNGMLFKQTSDDNLKEVSALTAEVEQLRKQVLFLRGQETDFHEAKRELSSASVELQRMTSKYEELAAKMSDVNDSEAVQELIPSRSINSLLEEIESLKADMSETNNRFKRTKDELNHMIDEMAKLSNQLYALESENAGLNSKILELKNISSGTQQVNLLEEELDKLKQYLDHVLSSAAQEKASNAEVIEGLRAQLLDKDKEISILSSEPTSSENSELINELNLLMERKMNAEASVAELTSECKALCSQLADYDKKSAQELTAFMRAAEEEMESLRHRYEAEKTSSNRRIQQLEERLQESDVAVIELKSRLEASQLEFFELKNVIQAKHAQVQIAEKDAAEEVKEALQLELTKVYHALKEKTVECTRFQDKLAAVQRNMDETLATKEQRIIHLEKSKLTKDQYDKIKQVREDRNKKTEECKIYKKQLVSLKSAYDELQRQSESSSSLQSTAELASMQVRLTENTAQLDQAKVICDSLKSKMKECSRQLQEYETEKQGVINILKTCGIDMSGVMINECGSEDSILEQDLSEAVGTLAQKWKYLSASYGDIREKFKVVENEKLQISSQLDSQTVQKAALERRVESLKSALHDTKEECIDLTNKLRKEVETKNGLNSQLEEAKLSVQSSKSAINVEIQVLEEENIELLKENKELRAGMATYKVQVERFLTENSGSGCSNKRASCDEPITERPIDSNGTKKLRISVDHNEENCEPVKAKVEPFSTDNRSGREFGKALDINQISVEHSITRPGRKERRAQKIAGPPTVCSESVADEQPGECAQS